MGEGTACESEIEPSLPAFALLASNKNNEAGPVSKFTRGAIAQCSEFY